MRLDGLIGPLVPGSQFYLEISCDELFDLAWVEVEGVDDLGEELVVEGAVAFEAADSVATFWEVAVAASARELRT